VRLLRISEEVELNMGSLALLDSGGFIPGAWAVVDGRDGEGAVALRVEGESGLLHLPAALSDRLFVGAA
jgi:hypothetical protein